MTPRRALLIVNRKSSQGTTDLSESVALLQEHGFQVVEEYPEAPRDTSEAIHRHAGAADLIILGGGDGTLNGGLEGVLESRLPLGVLPMGTANDLARTLGLPTTLAEACMVIVRGRERRIDLGAVNGKHFFNVASMGISVGVTERLTRDLKSRWGVFGYPLAVVDAFKASHPFRATIACGERVEQVRAIQIAVGNGRFYGGGMAVLDDAEIDDGRLDLYAIESQGLWSLAALLPFLRWGKYRSFKGIRLMQGPEIRVETAEPMAVNTDGELTTHTPATFRVVPKALSVFVP